MERHIIIASHSNLASGMMQALTFFAGNHLNLNYIDAYVDNKPVENEIDELMESFDDSDEIIVFTDIMAGSVNQHFFRYIKKPHTHIITGMNLPVVMALALENSDSYLKVQTINRIVEESKRQLIYMNTYSAENEDE